MPVFEYLAKHPEYSEIFNRAMTGLSAAIVPAALEAYDFSGINTLVDVAGGHGELLMGVLKKYPALRGILMDLDHVIAGAKPRIAAAGLTDRLQTATGDFFKAVPPGGDAYIINHIIHAWDDQRAGQILTTIHAALGPTKGRAILLERAIQPGT